MSSQRSNSMEASQDNIRKRVCKACDRCRLKKSKCDGASPCSRCKADNAICVFGERKKSQDKVYPKGYVDMLEQQQSQLVAGLRDLYSRLQNGQAWPGQPLREAQGGHPLTHDILERLDLLHSTGEGSSNYDGFEEDCNKMQQKLLEKGAPFTHRRGSISSNSDHGHSSSSRSSYDGTPPTKSIPYIDPFARNNAPPTPPMTSSFPRQSQIVHSIKQEAPVVSPTFMGTGALDPTALSQAPAWSAEPMMMDDTMYNFDTFTSFNSEPMILDPLSYQSNPPMPDWTDTNDLDFNTFIHSQVGA